MNPDKACYFKE